MCVVRSWVKNFYESLYLRYVLCLGRTRFHALHSVQNTNSSLFDEIEVEKSGDQ